MRTWGRLAMLLALAIVLGCGRGSRSTSDVKGEVTYDNKPVDKAIISFTPLDGGPMVGGPIVDGKFVVNNVVTGKNKVEVISGAATQVGGEAQKQDPGKVYKDKMKPYEAMTKTGGRMEAMRAFNRQREGGGDGAIPANAVGNRQVVEVSPGRVTLNFDLLKPSSKKN
jgi:hypothetical protein